jgi:predicted RNase H-like HicB family nuclease
MLPAEGVHAHHERETDTLRDGRGGRRSVSRAKIPVPVIISKEGRWLVASSPALDVATQGKTEEVVKQNMADLINDYLKDPDIECPN